MVKSTGLKFDEGPSLWKQTKSKNLNTETRNSWQQLLPDHAQS